MRLHTDPAVPKPLELSNYGSNINSKGSSQLIAPFDIIKYYPYSVNIAAIKVGRQ